MISFVNEYKYYVLTNHNEIMVKYISETAALH